MTLNNFIDRDSEKSILSFFLSDCKDLKFKNMLLAECREEFFTEKRELAFNAISELIREDVNPALDIVSKRISQSFSVAELAEIAGANSNFSNYEYYIRQLAESWKKRSLCRLLTDNLKTIENPLFNPEEVFASLNHGLNAVMDKSEEHKIYTVGDCMLKVTNDVSERMKPGYKSDRVLTGLSCIDSKMGGVAPSEMVVIGARPSRGKTALALSIFRNIISKNIPAGFISLEMSRMSLAYRLVSMQTGFSQFKLQHLPNEKKAISICLNGISQIGNKPGFIADIPNAPLYEVELTAKRLFSEFGARIIFIDYAGLIGRNSNEIKMQEYDWQSRVSKSMKGLARTLNIPIVVLVQLNRDAQDKAATMANIRGSGSWEHDADIIIFIQKNDELGDYLSVEKNRNGETGIAKVTFNKECTLFTDPLQNRF